MKEQQQTDSERRLLRVIEERLDSCLKIKKDRMEEAMVVLLAYGGFSIDTARDFASRVQSSSLPRWFEDRVVLNILQPIARTAAAMVVSNHPTWIVDPMGDSTHQRQAARGVQKMLDYFYRTNNLPSIMDQVVLRSVLTGYAGVYIDWDSQVGVGEYEEKNAGRDGWFVIEPVDIFSWHHEPGVGGSDKAFWGIRESTMHLEEARLFFNDPYIQKAVSSDEDDTVKRQLQLVADNEGVNIDFSQDTDRVRVLHYWQKPGAQFPNGLEVIVAGDRIVSFKDRLIGGEFPIYTMKFSLEPHRDYASGIGTSLLQLQRDLTVTWNGYRVRRDQEVMPPWFVPKGSLTRGINTRPKAINEYNPRMGSPQQMSLNPLSLVTGGFAERTIQMMEYVSGVNDASRGESPTSNATGRLTAFLAELDNRRMGPTVREMSAMMKRIGRRMIRLWQEFGSETIAVSILGRGHSAEIAEVRKEDVIYSSIDIDVASLMPRTQPLRQETILNLLQMGVVPPERALDALEFGGFEEAVGFRSVEAMNARQESEDLADLTIDINDIMAHDYEEHETHINEHIKYLLVEKPGDAIRERFVTHIEKHKAFIPQAAAQAAAAQQGAPSPMGGPPGLQIEGSQASPGGLPMEMIEFAEPGVDTGAEASLAAMAGLEQ